LPNAPKVLPPPSELPNRDDPNDDALNDALCPNRGLLNAERPAPEVLNRDAERPEERLGAAAERAVKSGAEDRPTDWLLLLPKECHWPSAIAALAL
jgi:hypothetical protein